MKIFAELSPDGKRIDVHFPYNPAAVERVKLISGRRFVGKDKGGPFWRLPLSLDTGRELRRHFGSNLELGDGLKAWGRDEIATERNLKSLANATDADLARVPAVLPELDRLIEGRDLSDTFDLPPLPNGQPHPLMRERDPRPYQRADIAMMAAANVLNANQPGTGKTVEHIGSIYEAGLEEGPHLIVAPVTAHKDPWVDELTRWQDLPVIWGQGPREREDAIQLASEMAANGEAFWLIVGYDDVRLFRDTKQEKEMIEGKLQHPFAERHPALFLIDWNSVVIDEFHKSGLPNNKSLFARGAKRLKATKRCAMSGTPMGGKPRRLFPTLQWLEPDAFTSFWAWAERWLVIEDNGFGKVIGGLKRNNEDEFYAAHARHLVRRLKREALPGLPLKNIQVIEVGMTKAQAKQYHAFARDAEIAIDEGRIAATNVLAEYTRLKQFANAKMTIDADNKPQPTANSGKLPVVLDRLDQEGVRKTDAEPGARAIVASASQAFVATVTEYLNGEGISARELSGKVKQGRERDAVIAWYKEPAEEPRVLVMTTQTGGVALNLEETGSIHVLDETWNPDDQEQLMDRADRGSRTTALNVYVYRTKDTIQSYIAEVNEGKEITNRDIIDARQRGIRATGIEVSA